MNEQELKAHIDELDAAIAGLNVNPEEKQRLADLVDEINAQLADNRLTSPAEGDTSLSDQVDGLVASFETDHPTVAGILKNIMMTLANMGV